MENLDLKNSQLCADVAKLASEHAQMAQYIKSALPFLKDVQKCSVYQDGQALLKKVEGK